MKTYLIGSFFLILVSHLSSAEGELDFILPDAVDYKIQQVNGNELHLFRLSRHPVDEDHWGPDLPMLIFMKMACDDYTEAIAQFEDKTEKQIEGEFLAHFESQSSHPVHGLDYATIRFSEFSGHRIRIDTQASSAGEVREFTLLITYLQNSDSCWMANGMSLRDDEDIETIDEILNSIQIAKQAETSRSADDNPE